MGPSPTIIYGRMCAIHLLEQWIVTKNAPIYCCHRLMRYSSGAKMQNPKPVNSWPRCQQGLGLFCRLRQQPSFFCVVCKKRPRTRPRQKSVFVVREIRACAAANFSHLFAVMAGHSGRLRRSRRPTLFPVGPEQPHCSLSAILQPWKISCEITDNRFCLFSQVIRNETKRSSS